METTNNAMHRATLVLVPLLLLTGLAIRSIGLWSPPYDFHPGRQFMCGNISRDFYLKTRENVPSWQQNIAEKNRLDEMNLEPHCAEYIAVFFYRLAGGEKIWIPRLFSAIFWLTGCLFIYLLCRRFLPEIPSLIALAFLVFMPYGILASRSFQSDPLMISLAMASWYFTYRFHENDKNSYLAIAVLCAGISIFTKATSLIMIVSFFGFLTLRKRGIPGSLKCWKNWLFAALAIAAPALFYVARGRSGDVNLDDQATMSFVPSLLLTAKYWLGWIKMIGRTAGIVPLALGIWGLFCLPRGLFRNALTGLFVGYLGYGLVFNYHIHTHDYYSFFLLVPVAVGLASLLATAMKKWGENKPQLLRSALLFCVATALVGALVCCGDILRNGGKKGVKKAVIHAGWFVGLPKKLVFFAHPGCYRKRREQQAMYKEIGELVEHSDKTIYLTHDFGATLKYSAWVAGKNWKESSQLATEFDLGDATLAEDFFNKNYAPLAPHFFICTMLDDLEKQQGLKTFLERNFKTLKKSADYVVFDLRPPTSSGKN